MIQGYEAEIKPGLWKRVVTMGIPKNCFKLFFGLAVIEVFYGIGLFGLRGLIASAILIGVEFLGMQWLTRQDAQWDEVRLAGWSRRYQTYYD